MPPTEGSKLTIDALVDIQTPKEVQISKSGSQVVYSLGAGTKKLDKAFVSSLWVADVGTLHSSRQITSGLFNDKSPKWSPDGESIAFISDRAKAGESSAIYLLSLKGGEAIPITKADNKKAISSFRWSPNGKFIAFTSADENSKEKEAKEKEKDDAKVYGEDWEYSRLRCVHVETREISNLFENDSHVDKFTWSSATEIVFTVQRTPDVNSPMKGVQFTAVSLSGKEPKLLANFPGAVSDLSGCEYIYFIAGTTPIVTCTSGMVYRLKTSPSQETKIEKVAFGIYKCAMDLRHQAKSLMVRVQDGLSDEIWCIEQSTSEGDGKLHRERYELSTWDVVEVEKVQILCFGKSEGDAPTEIFSKVNDEVVQLSNHGSAIASLQIMDTDIISCEAKDGIHIDAVLFTPFKSEKQCLPTVVVIHGGPYYRSSTSFDSSSFHWAPWLVSAGYAVLCPNYRGSSGYGEAFAMASKAGMGTKDYDDVTSLLKQGIYLGHIDEKRVGIGGWSQGGFLSYLAVTRPDFEFKAAVCGAGISDWDTMSLASDATVFEGELVGGSPWEIDAKSLAGRSASAVWHIKDHLKDTKTPILILHGKEDKRVPLYNALGFHRGCLHYGIDCELVIYPREGHPIYERQHRVDMLKRIRRFYDSHLM